MEVREIQPWKQDSPREVRVDGRVIEVRDTQSLKAPMSRELTPSGTV